jgi:hypothetical protein
MKPPLKLNAIDQEHLQELYDSLGTARDELPYTPKFDELVQGFQDRTFKNADHEQVFAALLKYVRSSSNASSEQQAVVEISDDQLKQLKIILSRHLTGGKILPYSDEMNSARTEFKKMAKMDLSELDFWRAIQKLHGSKRRPPRRAKVATTKSEEEEDDGE